MNLASCISSVIRQKGESQKRCFKKAKHAKFSEKRTFLPPDTHTYLCVSGGKKRSFFGKLGVLFFLETPVLTFTLLRCYRQYFVINILRLFLRVKCCHLFYTLSSFSVQYLFFTNVTTASQWFNSSIKVLFFLKKDINRVSNNNVHVRIMFNNVHVRIPCPYHLKYHQMSISSNDISKVEKHR